MFGNSMNPGCNCGCSPCTPVCPGRNGPCGPAGVLDPLRYGTIPTVSITLPDGSSSSGPCFTPSADGTYTVSVSASDSHLTITPSSISRTFANCATTGGPITFGFVYDYNQPLSLAYLLTTGTPPAITSPGTSDGPYVPVTSDQISANYAYFDDAICGCGVCGLYPGLPDCIQLTVIGSTTGYAGQYAISKQLNLQACPSDMAYWNGPPLMDGRRTYVPSPKYVWCSDKFTGVATTTVFNMDGTSGTNTTTTVYRYVLVCDSNHGLLVKHVIISTQITNASGGTSYSSLPVLFAPDSYVPSVSGPCSPLNATTGILSGQTYGYTLTPCSTDPYGMPSGGSSMMASRSLQAHQPVASAPDPAGRVRVGFLCPCLVMGGAEAWQLLLARSLDLNRFALAGVAVTGGSSRIVQEMADAYQGLMPVEAGPEAARDLANRSDVLITWAIDDLPGLLDGLPNSPKVVSVIHAPVESPWGQTVYARPDRIDRWVAVSELALQALPEASRAAAPATVIWNAVDAPRLAVTRSRDEMRSRWGVPLDAPVVGFLQRLSEEKYYQAPALLADQIPEPWHVVVVGDGDGRAELDRTKATKGLDRLHVVGQDRAAGDVLGAFDVLVVASDYESFCLTLAEGLWLGVPVVSTDVGIAKLHPGLTYPIPIRASGQEIARAVLEAHASGAKPGARVWARDRLDPSRFAREWNALIANVAGDRPGYPSLGRMALNLGQALVAHVADGGRHAPQDVQDDRLATCQVCPHYVATEDRCIKCGCHGAIKRALASSFCPDDPPRWGAV